MGPAGSNGTNGTMGPQGVQGAQGVAGPAGKDGTSFSLTKGNIYVVGPQVSTAYCKDTNDVLLTYSCFCGGGFCQGETLTGITDTNAQAGVSCSQGASSGAPPPTATVVCVTVP